MTTPFEDAVIHAAKEWKKARSGDISFDRLANAEHALVVAVVNYLDNK